MRKYYFVFSLLFHLTLSSLMATPAQVIIIRHGEKKTDGNLSKKGLERAGALAAYFTQTDELLLFGEPFAIFAARPTPPFPPFSSDENTERCLATVAPTAEVLRQPIHPGFSKLQESEIADFILNFPEYDGKNILICWHHETIQDLAIALGAVGAPHFPNVFDQTWVITYSPTIQLTIHEQKLLFGDTP